MPPLKLLLIGATGCVGSYLLDALQDRPHTHLYLSVRDPLRLPTSYCNHPHITLLPGGLQDLVRQAELLAEMNVVIHAAADWGSSSVFAINLRATWQLLQSLNPASCRQVFYFSTASVLDAQHQLLPMAWRTGTDYIRSKALLAGLLPQLSPKLREGLTVLYPTVILGGDQQHPYSHVSASIPQWPQWLWWLRYLKAQGCFYFIHARDIAQIVVHGLEHPLGHQVVLGNAPYTVNQALSELCACFNLPRPDHPILLDPALPLLQWVLSHRMSNWDRYCLQQQRFTHYHVTNARSLDLGSDLWTLRDIVKSNVFV